MTTHGQTLRTFGSWASIVGLAEADRYLIVNPFFHTFGYKAGIVACLIAGATIVPEPVFDVDRVLAKVAAERISMLPGPPTLYQSILDHPDRSAYDLSSLRLAVTGAAAVPVELILRMRTELTFSTVLTAYGLTEATGVVTMCRQTDAPEIISHSSGRAIPEHRGPDRRRRRGGRARQGSRGRSSSAATPSSPATSRTPMQRPRPSIPTAGSTPGTSGSWTPAGTSPSPTG